MAAGWSYELSITSGKRGLRSRRYNVIMHPADVALSKTFHFVMSVLPPSAARPLRILEVGCGTGALAARLAEAGYQVLALDSSPAAVRSARARGVDAQVVTWRWR
jgi:2-polyprenyl-3-methyl-5-hydroxy-6-metoxy-1,4-benzoquinol methylase